MRHSELRDGMKIRATDWWADCWKKGDEFIVNWDNEEKDFFIQCHDEDNGPEHSLADGDDLALFEPVDTGTDSPS